MIRGTEVVSRPHIRVERYGRIGTGKGYSCWLSMLPGHLDLVDDQSQRWSGALAVQNLNETLGITAAAGGGVADDSTLTPSWRSSR
jgi:hypothetical protein